MNAMKKFISLILCLITALSMTAAKADTAFEVVTENNKVITVELNKKALVFDVPPKIVNDRTMVPLRAIAEQLGFIVLWNDADKTIIMTNGNKVVTMQIDNTKFFKNNQELELSSPPMIDSARTLVPVRAIAESFDIDVDWNEDEKIVILTTKNYVY